MSFLNNTGVTTLWSRIMNYLTGAHVKTSVVSGETDVDGALTKLQTKTGTAALTTQATDLSGAVNELNSELDAQSQQIGNLNDAGMSEPTLSKSINRASKILQPKSIGEYGATAGYEALTEPWNLTYFVTSTGDSTNPTTTGQWRILQFGDANFGAQLAVQTGSIGIYQRNKNAGNWGQWTQL